MLLTHKRLLFVNTNLKTLVLLVDNGSLIHQCFAGGTSVSYIFYLKIWLFEAFLENSSGMTPPIKAVYSWFSIDQSNEKYIQMFF